MESLYLVTEGDSITAGNGSSNGVCGWPRQMAWQFTGPRMIGVSNLATPAETLLNMTTSGTSQADSQYDAAKGTNYLIVMGGINDLYALTGILADAETVYNRLVAYCQARVATGFKVIVMTILPCSSVGRPANLEANRQTINASIRANYLTFAHALADVGNDPDMGQDGQESGAYYAGDNVHPSDAGYAIIAAYAKAAVVALGA